MNLNPGNFYVQHKDTNLLCPSTTPVEILEDKVVQLAELMKDLSASIVRRRDEVADLQTRVFTLETRIFTLEEQIKRTIRCEPPDMIEGERRLGI